MRTRGVWLTVFLLASISSSLLSQNAASSSYLKLSDGWSLQSSRQVNEDGAVLASPTFRPTDWLEVTVPTTVVAAMVSKNMYPDPFFAMNLRKLPGMTYPIGMNFSNLPMDPASPFAVPWWYRKEFTVPAEYSGKTLWLNFRGINYRANIWLNGKQIATSDEVAGAWRTYEFNVTGVVKPGGENVLAVEVFPPTENDLAITFVDWNPAPPDKNMGLWREVYLTASGAVALRDPAVISKLDSSGGADLTVTALLRNPGELAVHGTLKGQIEEQSFSQDVELKPGEEKDVSFTSQSFPQLHFAAPRLWWPVQMGKPNLYPLRLEFEVNDRTSDVATLQFGIREMGSQLDAQNHRVFTVNGKKILIRGGGWSPDMMLRHDPERMRQEFRYVLDMGLNTIRLEGKLESEDFLEMADREGILLMAGWCCCDHWEHWSKWKEADYKIAQVSLRDQMYRLRNHPSLVMWLNGSDNPPPPDVEQMYLDVENKCQWPNPVVSSAKHIPTPVSGDNGVKMSGPYEYIAPSYWLEDDSRGGAHGFNTETSPGPAVPPIESLERMLGKDHLWPIDDTWNYHAGGGKFKDIQVFRDALNARYGEATDARDFALKSQLMTYEGIRAMFEAYSRNKYTSTGVIQWMLNNAWPSTIWHLYDFYLRPGGGYFGAKQAMRPLHAVYSYNDASVWVVSSRYDDVKGLKLSVRVLDLNLKERFNRQVKIDANADSTKEALRLPKLDDLTPVYFVALRIEDAKGATLDSNFYWLSAKQETLDWEKSNWWMTPTANYADYTALQKLPRVKLKVASQTEKRGDDAITHVTIENPGANLAFFIRLKVNKGEGGEEILPVLWQDNYISLLPGEKRELTATYRYLELGAAKPAVEVSGWNVE